MIESESEYETCMCCHKMHDCGPVPVCNACEEKYGHHLAKATSDQFDFVVGLRTGVVMRFISKTLSIEGDWVFLPEPDTVIGLPFPFCRGMQVRLSEIAWVADAPEGS